MREANVELCSNRGGRRMSYRTGVAATVRVFGVCGRRRWNERCWDGMGRTVMGEVPCQPELGGCRGGGRGAATGGELAGVLDDEAKSKTGNARAQSSSGSASSNIVKRRGVVRMRRRSRVEEQ